MPTALASGAEPNSQTSSASSTDLACAPA
jgi:hypothetical protein